MLLFSVFLTYSSLAAGQVVNDTSLMGGVADKLQWPEKYTFKATQMTLTLDLVQNYTAWVTKTKSRKDSGHDTTIKIHRDKDLYLVYQVFPKTIKNEVVQNACKCFENQTLSGLDKLQTVEDKDYRAIANESVIERSATKFVFKEEKTNWNVYHTFWAVQEYIENGSYWIPIRYEFKEFNRKLSFVDKHVIVDFYEFSVDFNESVFDTIERFCDKSKLTNNASDSDTVMKELMFIDSENEDHVDLVFNRFKNEFNPNYAHEEEHNFRRNIFKDNMRLISSTNRQNLGYKLAVNHFSDRTPQELKTLTGLKRETPGIVANIDFPYKMETLGDFVEKLPVELDLRLEGLVTPVQYQGDCGSCWAFGATSAAEGALARVNGGRLIRLSNQALIDCAWEFGASGCYGGSDNAAFEWMMKYGLPTIEDYGEYEQRNGYCHIKNMTIYPIRGYTDVTPFSENALKVALLYHGPISVSIVTTAKMKQYSSGIFNDLQCRGKYKMNHEVTLVGYGEKYGELYWIIKNSWGVNWGEDGYMLISAKNDCGITIEPTYVVF